MIQTKDLTKKYGEFTAVGGISLHVAPGEIYGFLGPNGAGKTTTVNMLAGILQPTSGDIFLFDEKYNFGRIEIKRRIGVVPEKHPQGVWDWMTVYEYLYFFSNLYKVLAPRDRILTLLNRVGLQSVQKKRLRELSRGMLQKISIVRALIHDPEILFLDEPISGLDPIGIKQVRDLLIHENCEGRTIFISSHILSEMEKVCNRVGIIFNGKLIAEDLMKELLLKLTDKREIVVELDQAPLGFEEKIKMLPFVIDCHVQKNIFHIQVQKKGDYRRDISKLIIENSFIPLNITEKTASLEDAFVTITQENLGMLIGGNFIYEK